MKKKKIIYLSLLILLILIILFVGVLTFKSVINDKEESFNEFNWKEVDALEFNQFSLCDFVEDVNYNEEDEEYYYNNTKLEYSISGVEKLGENEITVKINYQGQEYSKNYKVEVKDTVSPTIQLSKEEDSILKNDEFDAKTYLVDVNDNYDELKIDDVKIEHEVDTKKIGDYEVVYKISDSNENEAIATLKIHIVETQEEVEENNKKTETNSELTNIANTNNTANATNTSSTSKTSNTNSSQTTNQNNNQNNNNNNTSTTTSNFKNDINSVSLNPVITRYTEFDNQIGSAINSTVKGSMSNYDKLVALYDYVKNKLSYKMSIINMNDINNLIDKYHYYYDDAAQLINAKMAMDTNTGVCDNYAALFMILSRRVGFDSYVISGQAPNQSGGRGGHAWVLIRANGKNYFFDPQIEDYNGTKYNLFGKTETEQSSIYSNYSISNSISTFSYFKERPFMTTNITIGGAVSKTVKQTTYTSDYQKNTANIEKGDTLTISTNSSGYDSFTYLIKITENGKDTILKSGTGKGETITANYTFNEEGNAQVYIRIKGANASTEYSLYLTVEDKSKITDFSYYSCLKYPSGVIRLEFTPYGGYAPYSYKIDIIETDATKDYSVDDANSDYQYLTPGDGTYFKIRVTVKDSKGTSFSEDFKYDVVNNILTEIS